MQLVAHSKQLTAFWSKLQSEMKAVLKDALVYNQLELCIPFEVIYARYNTIYVLYKQGLKDGLEKFAYMPALTGEEEEEIKKLDGFNAQFSAAHAAWVRIILLIF